MIRKIIKKIKLYLLKKRGLTYGKNVNIEKGVIIDPSIPFLIKIGNNVTLAPYVHILAHDASTKTLLGYTKIGEVIIGNNVFVGAKTIILPNIKIGNNVIIGAGSVITKDIPDNVVVAGAPARIIQKTDVYIEKHKNKMNEENCFKRKKINKKYIITEEMRNQIKKEISEKKDIVYLD